MSTLFLNKKKYSFRPTSKPQRRHNHRVNKLQRQTYKRLVYDHSSPSDSLQTLISTLSSQQSITHFVWTMWRATPAWQRPYFCHFMFLWIWGTELHVNTKTEIKTGLIAKAAPQKHPLITEVMVSILYSPNWFLLHSDVLLHSTIDSNTTVDAHRIGPFSQCFPGFISTVQTHYALWDLEAVGCQNH